MEGGAAPSAAGPPVGRRTRRVTDCGRAGVCVCGKSVCNACGTRSGGGAAGTRAGRCTVMGCREEAECRRGRGGLQLCRQALSRGGGRDGVVWGCLVFRCVKYTLVCAERPAPYSQGHSLPRAALMAQQDDPPPPPSSLVHIRICARRPRILCRCHTRTTVSAARGAGQQPHLLRRGLGPSGGRLGAGAWLSDCARKGVQRRDGVPSCRSFPNARPAAITDKPAEKRVGIE